MAICFKSKGKRFANVVTFLGDSSYLSGTLGTGLANSGHFHVVENPRLVSLWCLIPFILSEHLSAHVAVEVILRIWGLKSSRKQLNYQIFVISLWFHPNSLQTFQEDHIGIQRQLKSYILRIYWWHVIELSLLWNWNWHLLPRVVHNEGPKLFRPS